jgi:hypothetical protein
MFAACACLLSSMPQVGLSQPFAEWLLPLIAKHFPDFPKRSPQDFYAAENVIKSPSLIRVEADEVRAACLALGALAAVVSEPYSNSEAAAAS